MLKKIKSSYITKLLFIYINEKQKIKLVRYNKSIQNNINLSIINYNYKYFIGKYIIYESNGIGKVYYGYDNALKFKGKYSKNQKNGKGKEYDIEDNLLFESEY